MMKKLTTGMLLSTLLLCFAHIANAQARPSQCPHVNTLQQEAVFYVDDSQHGPVALDFSRFHTDRAWVLIITKPQSMPNDQLLDYANTSLKTLQAPMSLSPTTMALDNGTTYAVCTYPIAKGSKVSAMLVTPPANYIKNVL
jgi:hypothetical protein